MVTPHHILLSLIFIDGKTRPLLHEHTKTDLNDGAGTSSSGPTTMGLTKFLQLNINGLKFVLFQFPSSI